MAGFPVHTVPVSPLKCLIRFMLSTLVVGSRVQSASIISSLQRLTGL